MTGARGAEHASQAQGTDTRRLVCGDRNIQVGDRAGAGSVRVISEWRAVAAASRRAGALPRGTGAVAEEARGVAVRMTTTLVLLTL